MLLYLLFTLLGFLSGGVLYSQLIAAWFCGVDISEISDDRNPGAANVFKYGNTKYGIAALILDIFKGFVPVYTAVICLDMNRIYFVPVLVAPVLGHAIAPFFKKHGGKAISVSFGCLIGLIPNSFIVFVLAAFLVVFTFILTIRPDSLRCIVAYSLFSIYCLHSINIRSIKYGCILIAATVILKHIKSYQHTKAELHIIHWDFWSHRN